MRIHVPPRRIRERFLIIYELRGCQKAVDYLTEYYDTKQMRIVLDGRRVPRKCCGVYFDNIACLTRDGLKKRVVLHELFHHLVQTNGLELQIRREEKEADSYAEEFLKTKLARS